MNNAIFWDSFYKKAAMREVATVALLSVSDRKMLMGKRRDNGKWTNAGGHLEKGEQPLAGAVRELKEETGIELGEDDLIHVRSKTVTKPDGERLKIHAYKAFIGGQKPRATSKNDPDGEVERWRWVPMPGGLPKDIADNLHVPMGNGRNVLLDNLNFSEPDERFPKMAFWSGFTTLRKTAKLRGRSLRELRTFLAKNKMFVGHATTREPFQKSLRRGKLLSPHDLFRETGQVPAHGEGAQVFQRYARDAALGKSNADKLSPPDFLAKNMKRHNLVYGYPGGLPDAAPLRKAQGGTHLGEHGFLFPQSQHMHVSADPRLDHREVTSRLPVSLEGALNVAPRKTINQLRRDNPDKLFISREDLKARHPDLFKDYQAGGSNIGE
jgi:8-oxo-dGTP pyrophosphatase MutT (NUDIX family)